MTVLWGLCLLLVLTTFGEGGASPKALLAGHALLASILIVALVRSRAASFRLDPAMSVCLAAFGALALTGALLAPYGYAAFLVVEEIAAFVAVAALGARVGADLLPALGAAIGAAACLQCLWALAQRFTGGVLRPAGGFLNANHLAAWLAAALFLMWGVAASRGRKTRAAVGLVTALALAVLIVIGSRGALIGLAAGAATAFACVASARHRRATRLVGIAALVLLAVGAAGVALRFRVADPLGAVRPAIWKAAARVIFDRPWLGTRPGQFETLADNLNFPREGEPLRFDHAFNTPHSDVLRAPVEFGIPAALAVAAAFLVALRFVTRRVHAGRLNGAGIGAIAAIAAIGAQGTVNDLTETPALYLLAAALLGALLSVEKEKATVPFGSGIVPSSLMLAVLLAVDFGGFTAWTIQRSLPRGALPPAQREALERARRFNAFQPDLAIRVSEDLVARSTTWDDATYAAAREAAEEAIRLSPESPAGYRALARVEGSACRDLFRDVATRERAAAAYAEAEARAQHDPFIPIEAGQLLLSTQDPSGARRAAIRALRIEPNAIPARLLLAEASLAEGSDENNVTAREMLREADALALRFAGQPKESQYAVRLLTADPATLSRIRSALGVVAKKGS